MLRLPISWECEPGALFLCHLAAETNIAWYQLSIRMLYPGLPCPRGLILRVGTEEMVCGGRIVEAHSVVEPNDGELQS